jgi:hypothetical protein
MTRDDQTVVDFKGTEVVVGSKVKWGADDILATVYEITDMDADYDDELQRGVMYPPKIKLRFDDDGTEEVGGTFYSGIPSPDDQDLHFTCDDLEVIS